MWCGVALIGWQKKIFGTRYKQSNISAEASSTQYGSSKTEESVANTEVSDQREENPWIDVTNKKVALTYDDGPDARYTREILEVLDEYQVLATFFVMGKAVEENPQIVTDIAKEGHSLGNHTYSHANLGQLSVDAGRAEIDRTNELIYECTGNYPILFRPPFGNYPNKLEEESDLVFVLWDVDPLDWQCQNTDTICKKVMKNIAENDIILMYDAYETTVEATRILIPQLQKEGYQFVTVEELLME